MGGRPLARLRGYRAAGSAGFVALLLLVAGCGGDDDETAPRLTDVRPQQWTHAAGTCSSVEGAVFSRSADGCGGTGTAFDDDQIYLPSILDDVATEAAPCPGIATGDRCYRMWYVGNDAEESRRIGYAVSPDGVTWTRVPGAVSDASVLEPGGGDRFDSFGVSAPTVVKDGDVFRMWYTGLGKGNSIQGIGYATSIDGRTWEKVEGPAEGGAVLRESGVKGDFDEHEIITATVLKDAATVAAPCEGVSPGDACYRMWYEGIDTNDYYRYRVGYATSADGVSWTKVRGDDPSGAVVGLGAQGAFDGKGVGVPNVIKDGALFQMWYEAFDEWGRYSIGHVSSRDGVAWERADPDGPVLTGAEDPGTFEDDGVWTATVLKEGAAYHMWYTVSAKPESTRFGMATMTPGSPLADLKVTESGGEVGLSFTTGKDVPLGGSVLVTFPAGVDVLDATLQTAPEGAAVDLETAVTDGPAGGVARRAIVLRPTEAWAPGTTTLRIALAGDAGDQPIVVQTFDTREVLEHGTVVAGA